MILMTAEIRLHDHRYGKSAVRLVHVSRHGHRHCLADLDVNITLAGDLSETYLTGDNGKVLATDSQKNTVYAFAKQFGISRVEDFAMELARHFVRSQSAVNRSRIRIDERRWERITAEHSFARSGTELRTTVVTYDGERTWIIGGMTGLDMLNTTGSEFRGYPRDPYTTLPETGDRILATSLTAHWRYATADGDWDDWHATIRSALMSAFADTYSKSLQQTLYAMGQRAMEACPQIAEIRLTLPNKHHLLVELDKFGLGNPNEVFVATQEPFGLIEGTLVREGAPEPGLAWW